MAIKRLLVRERVRQLPAQFSWLDHRLVRDRHIERCDAPACALYLFLVTVADAQGLSYYSEGSIAKRLSMDVVRLGQARADLVRLGLLAYEHPLYQVLALDTPVMPAPTREISPQHWRERLAQVRARLEKAR
jgi:hypothetical protein